MSCLHENSCINYELCRWHTGDYAHIINEVFPFASIMRLGKACNNGFDSLSIDDGRLIGWVHPQHIREVRSIDWCVTLKDGDKYRAYRGKDRLVVLYIKSACGSQWGAYYPTNETFCKLGRIPIMPYDACMQLQCGKFEYPE